MAPEFLRNKEMNYVESTEIYSFGVCIWEVFSDGANPYPGLQPV